MREGRGRGQESGEIFVELFVRARDSEIGRSGVGRISTSGRNHTTHKDVLLLYCILET